MSAAGREWRRVERLDAAHLAVGLERETGVRLTVEGPCRGGQVGAAYVRWPDGRRSVLKRRPGADAADLANGPLAVMEALGATGYPAPASELVAQVGGAVVMVQQLLPGSAVDRLDSDLLDQVLALNSVQAGVLAGRDGLPLVRLYLRDDGPGFCLHGPLRGHGRRARALDDWVAEVAAEHPHDLLEGDDAVHFDFHSGNILAAEGSVTGVVDWDGAARGDRLMDLVTLRFGTRGGAADPGVTRRLDALLDSASEAALRRCWAHMSLRTVDWAIRHFAYSDVEHRLDLAEARTG